MNTTRTTVYLDSTAYEQIKRLARRRGQTAAALIREAVSEYVADQPSPEVPRSIGLGRSGRGDIAERSEELLDGWNSDE